MEGDSALFERKGAAILAVADDRAADGGELRADLVIAARFESNTEEEVGTSGADEFIGEDRVFADAGESAVVTVGKLVFEASKGVGWLFGDQGEVGLLTTTLADGRHQARERFARFGEDDDTAHRLIDAMDRLEKGVGFAKFRKKGVRFKVGRLDKKASRLVDDEQVVIFKEAFS